MAKREMSKNDLLTKLYYEYEPLITRAFKDHTLQTIKTRKEESEYFYDFISDLYEAAKGNTNLRLKHTERFQFFSFILRENLSSATTRSVTKLRNELLNYDGYRWA